MMFEAFGFSGSSRVAENQLSYLRAAALAVCSLFLTSLCDGKNTNANFRFSRSSVPETLLRVAETEKFLV